MGRRADILFGLTLTGHVLTWFQLGGCSKCSGDLAYDDGDWICMQCGTYFYTGLYRREEKLGVKPCRLPRPQSSPCWPTGKAVKTAATPSPPP